MLAHCGRCRRVWCRRRWASAADVRGMLPELFAELRERVDAEGVETMKAALGDPVERIELDPVSERCRIYYRLLISFFSDEPTSAKLGIRVSTRSGFGNLTTEVARTSINAD